MYRAGTKLTFLLPSGSCIVSQCQAIQIAMQKYPAHVMNCQDHVECYTAHILVLVIAKLQQYKNYNSRFEWLIIQ